MKRTRFETPNLWLLAAHHSNAIAKAASQRLGAEGDLRMPDQRFYDGTVIAIIFSALSAEGWLNDLTWACDQYRERDPLLRRIAVVLQELESSRISVVGRALLASQVIPDWEGLSRGHAPLQDIDLLIRLRNMIAHIRPETRGGKASDDSSRHFNLVRRLAALQLCEEPEEGDLRSWLELISTPRVSQWACLTVSRLIAAFRARLLPALSLTRGRSGIEFILDGYDEGYLFPPLLRKCGTPSGTK